MSENGENSPSAVDLVEYDKFKLAIEWIIDRVVGNTLFSILDRVIEEMKNGRSFNELVTICFIGNKKDPNEWGWRYERLLDALLTLIEEYMRMWIADGDVDKLVDLLRGILGSGENDNLIGELGNRLNAVMEKMELSSSEKQRIWLSIKRGMRSAWPKSWNKYLGGFSHGHGLSR